MIVVPTYQPPASASLAQAPVPQADVDRKERMRDAWKAYRGEFSPPLRILSNQPNDNVISNRCEPIINKGVSFLFGQVVKIEANKETPQPQSTVQDFLDCLWGDDDDRMTLLSQMAINGGVCGEVFVKLIPATGTMKYPRLVVLDPLLVRIVTAPDDCTLTLAYIIEYPGTDQWQKRQVIARIDPDGLAEVEGPQDLDDYWTITNYQRRGQSGSWVQRGAPEVWPYPFAPIFCCQNLPNPNEAWGQPDLTPDLIEINKTLNFIQSNTARIIKFHAHPMKYAIGVQAAQLQVSVDEILCLPASDSKLNILEMHSDLSSSLKFAETLRNDMDEQSRVPSVALGRLEGLPRGNISGVALELLFQPLIEKTIQKQRLYGRLIRDICRAALVISNTIPFEGYEDYEINLHWQNLLPVDDLAAAQTAMLLKQIGVSDQTIMAELGYNADDEMAKGIAEDQKKQALMPPAMQPQMGQPPSAQEGA